MKAIYYPLLIISLLVLAGYAFYNLYQTKDNSQTTLLEPEITMDDTLFDEAPIDLREFSHLHTKSIEQQSTFFSITSSKKEKTLLEVESYHETPKETEAIYASLTPENNEEILEEAHAAFMLLDDESSQERIKLLEEEAQIKEDATLIEDEEVL